MIEIGYVRAIKDKNAIVVFKRKSGCGDNCAACKSHCNSLKNEVEVPNSLNAKIGDQVELTLETKSFFKMTLLAYGFPLLMAVIGLFLGAGIFQKLGYKNYELLASIVSIAFLAVSYTIIGGLDKKLAKNDNYQVKITRIVESINSVK